jgi:putative N6-adenine-specific DNA methylase
MNIIAKTFHGLEPVLMRELSKIGAKNVQQINRAVIYSGDLELIYRSNLELRTALRILLPIIEFEANNEHSFYQNIYDFDWSQYLDIEKTFAIDTVVNSEFFKHSKYIALKGKDAIADHFRKKFGKRPNVNTVNPDVRINIHIHEQKCTVSLDSSGSSLHKRGYRVQAVEAPLNEVMAAGLVLLSGWTGENVLIDPMCGSGTIAIEAAMVASNTPPAFLRQDFSFTNWNNFNPDLWKKVKDRAFGAIKDVNQTIFGLDKNLKSIKGAHLNAIEAQLDNYILFEKADFFKYEPSDSPMTIIMNPPYEKRLQTGDILDFYEKIGSRIKHSFTDSVAWIFSGNLEALNKIGLRPSAKFNLFNGPIPSKFLKFELYRGSRKTSKQ